MSIPVKMSDQLLEDAQGKALYKKLIQQLNKDFLLTSIPVSFSETVLPSQLKTMLFATIKDLIDEQFEVFLNLLYRIDLPEAKIRNLPKENHQEYIAMVSYLILEREWQKVVFKSKFSL